MSDSTFPDGDNGCAQRAAPAVSGGTIRVGIGGWRYDPWRETFYPRDVQQKEELRYASRRVTAIEIDSTYYRLQKPASFAKWRDETPDDFMFSLKATMFTTNRKVLAEGAGSIEWFMQSGFTELGTKLGPIVWQFATTKQFQAAEFEDWLQLLPPERDGVPLRHVLDVRHPSFRCSQYLALARRYGMATVYTDSDDYPLIPDVTGPFVYLRLMRMNAALEQGFAPEVFDQLAACARWWRDGNEPANVPRVEPAPPPAPPRDVFVYFINGAKERAPAAAMALLERVGR
jgi:uncharacterized protein YecE (DUF72 family)